MRPKADTSRRPRREKAAGIASLNPPYRLRQLRGVDGVDARTLTFPQPLVVRLTASQLEQISNTRGLYEQEQQDIHQLSDRGSVGFEAPCRASEERTPFEFVDMSVKEPWDEAWKTKCRSRIQGCDGVIVIVTKNTLYADGQRWEVKAAKEERIPTLGIYATTDDRPVSLPVELDGVRVVGWTWDTIKGFIDRL